MTAFRNLKVGTRLIGSFLGVAGVLVVGTLAGIFSLKLINDNNQTMYATRLLPIQALGEADEYLNKIPGDTYKYLIIPKHKDDATTTAPALSAPARCAGCHAPQATSAQHGARAIANTGVKNCAECHADKVGDPTHGQTSGKSIDTSTECATCHSTAVIGQQLTEIEQTITSDLAAVNAQIAAYRALKPNLTPAEKDALIRFESAWKKHQLDITDIIGQAKAGNERVALHQLIGGEASLSHLAAEQTLGELILIDQNLAEQAQADSNATFNLAVSALFVSGLIGIGLALGLGFFITRTITLPLGKVAQAASEIAEGDLGQTVDIQAQDEIGQMARSFNRMIIYLQSMATIAEAVAAGDLTHEVHPKSKRDVLGLAFAQMIANLRHLVGDVTENAEDVGAASEQLASTAVETGQATHQISVTIHQVARGIAQQTQSVTQTTHAAEQMKQVSEVVARGAQEQAAAVARSSSLTAQISESIRQVAANAQTGAQGAAAAAAAAYAGTQTVAETIQGMDMIKSRVDLSAEKVKEMGRRSEQIGVIVETIDNIASQTNLLALNAAIEAARAGKHGEGFGVVASEVRRLAELSSAATKEISELVHGIQQTASEAVAAMDGGAQEVEAGVNRTHQAGQALANILSAVESVHQQVGQISAAAQQVNAATEALVSAMEAMGRLVQKNLASTETMAANSAAVTQAMEDIASVSEENNAATEEVSAATAEVNQQVREVTSSAQALSHMALTLQELVGQFQLSHHRPPAPQAPVTGVKASSKL